MNNTNEFARKPITSGCLSGVQVGPRLDNGDRLQSSQKVACATNSVAEAGDFKPATALALLK